MASGPITSWEMEGKKWKQWLILYTWTPKSLQNDCSSEVKKMLAPWKESYDKTRQHIKNQRHHLANKGPYTKSYDFCGSHLQI